MVFHSFFVLNLTLTSQSINSVLYAYYIQTSSCFLWVLDQSCDRTSFYGKNQNPHLFFFFKNFGHSNPPPSFSNCALSGKNFHLILIRIFLVNFDILAACQKSEILFRRTCIVLSCGQLRRMISSEF